jgi:hypothetical protein
MKLEVAEEDWLNVDDECRTRHYLGVVACSSVDSLKGGLDRHRSMDESYFGDDRSNDWFDPCLYLSLA